MSSKCLLVQGISPALPPLFLRQIFEQFGPCQVEPKGDFALIQYQNPDFNHKVIQYLHNTDLMGKNSQKVGIQIIDLATLNQLVNNKINGNSNSVNENAKLQQNNVEKSSLDKKFGVAYQVNMAVWLI